MTATEVGLSLDLEGLPVLISILYFLLDTSKQQLYKGLPTKFLCELASLILPVVTTYPR